MEQLAIEHIIPFVEAHRYTGYAILFFAMVLEGESVLIIAGMLASINAFDRGDVLWISFLGEVLGNLGYYYLGSIVKDKGFAKRMIARAQRAVTYFLPHFREKPFTSIFFSKFIYGVNRATVFMSGVFRVDMKLFFKAELLASIVWVILYFCVGYFFGQTAIKITNNAAQFALLMLGFVVAFILLQRTLTHSYERRKHKKLESR